MKARFLALAALVLGMVSCQQDVELATPQGGEVDFQLKVDAVELATRAGKDGAADTQAAHDSAFASSCLQNLQNSSAIKNNSITLSSVSTAIIVYNTLY